MDVEQQIRTLIAQQKIKKTAADHEVTQPFGFDRSVQCILGDARFLTNRNKKYFNQVHLQQLVEQFIDNRLCKTVTRVDLPKQGDMDEDEFQQNIIMKDLIKKGQLRPDANFQELNHLLQNDPEYQSMLRENAEKNQAGAALSAERLAAMDGLTQRIEDGEEAYEYGEEGEEAGEGEEEPELDLSGLDGDGDEVDGSDEEPAGRGMPTLMSVEEYRAMRQEREAGEKKRAIPRPQPSAPEGRGDGADDNASNPLFQAMAKNAKK